MARYQELDERGKKVVAELRENQRRVKDEGQRSKWNGPAVDRIIGGLVKDVKK